MDGLDVNTVALALLFGPSRQVTGTLCNMNRRSLEICEFGDNEHFTTLESLVVQVSPNSDDSEVSILVSFPELPSEKKKVVEILEEAQLPFQELPKKLFTPQANHEEQMNFLLRRPFKQYVEESNCNQGAASCLVQYLRLEKDKGNQNAFDLRLLKFSDFMRLDLAAFHSLMIFPKSKVIQSLNRSCNSLVEYLDRCKTLMGRRCLRRWVNLPLQSVDRINHRLDIVDHLATHSELNKLIQNTLLKKLFDLDQLATRFYKRQANQKSKASSTDCLKAYQLIQLMKEYLQKVSASTIDERFHHTLVQQFQHILEQFSKLEAMMVKYIDLEKAASNEFIVRPGFSEALRETHERIQRCKKQVERIRQVESEKLGIEVKLVESNTHSFVLEANKKQADDAFRCQKGKKYKSLSIRNRVMTFTLDALQEVVYQHDDLVKQYEEQQQAIVEDVINIVSGYYPVMDMASQAIAELDVYCSFAELAYSSVRPLVRPTMSTGDDLILIGSRHPLLEEAHSEFIANDLSMNRKESRMHIITGPNMGGKSTYIRQAAICVMMAHIGCFVPCAFAEIPIIDAIITRVGASDMQLRGISTFMSEMLEASCMLKVGTEKSLIIIDELGRGTSTSEGFGLAWAIAEEIVSEMKALCLFATHFHEMTRMEDETACVKNFHVDCVIKERRTMAMEYKVKRGASDRSYGILVAEMLDFPEAVLRDARQKAEELEGKKEEMEEGKEEDLTGRIVRRSRTASKEQQARIWALVRSREMSDQLKEEILAVLE